MDSSRREKARLPVVLITRRTLATIEGVLLGSWSGKLLGDMELQAWRSCDFCWALPAFHDPAALHWWRLSLSDLSHSRREWAKVNSSGLSMLHSCAGPERRLNLSC